MLKYAKLICILLFVSLISSFLGYSQVDISIGAPFGNRNSERKYNFVRDGELLVVFQTKESCVLQRFDSKQNLAFENELEFPRGYEIRNVIELGKRILMFYSCPLDKKGKLKTLFYVEIDFSKGAFLGSEKLILDNSEKFYVNPVNNESFNVMHSYIDYKDGSTTKSRYRLDVFDVNLKLVSSAQIFEPYSYYDVEYYDSMSSSSGYLFTLYNVYPGGRKKGSDELRLDAYLELVRFDLKSGAVAKIPIKFGKLYDVGYRKIRIQEGEDGTVSVAGNYYDKKENLEDHIVDGFFLTNIDTQGNIKNTSFYKTTTELSEEDLKPFDLSRKKIKMDGLISGYPDLRFKKIIKESDGSILLVGERNYDLFYSNATISYYEDIIIFKIDSFGKLAWTKVFPKIQKEFRDLGDMSFSLIKDSQFYFFLFIDNKNNFGLNPGEKINIYDRFGGGNLTALRVDIGSGITTKYKVFDVRNVLGIEVQEFQQNRIIDAGSGRFFLNAINRGGKDFLIKVNLPVKK